MKRPARNLTVVLSPPESGCDDERISRALDLLISEEDVIEYLRRHARYHDGGPRAEAASKGPSENQ
jgi:hypothetical protein